MALAVPAGGTSGVGEEGVVPEVADIVKGRGRESDFSAATGSYRQILKIMEKKSNGYYSILNNFFKAQKINRRRRTVEEIE